MNKVVFGGLNLPGCYPISPVSPWYTTTKGLQCNLHANVDRAEARRGVRRLEPDGAPDGRRPIRSRPARRSSSSRRRRRSASTSSIDPTEFVTSLNRADAGNFDTFRDRLVGPRRPGRQHLRVRRDPGTLNDRGYSNPKLDYVLAGAASR